MTQKLAAGQFPAGRVCGWARSMLAQLAEKEKAREDEYVAKQLALHARLAAMPIIRWFKPAPPTREKILANMSISDAMRITAGSWQEDRVKKILALAERLSGDALVTLTDEGVHSLGLWATEK